MIYHRASYSFDDLPEAVEESIRDLVPHAEEFDVIAAQGLSGVVVAAPVSLRLGKLLAVLRKSSDDCHSGSDLMIGHREVQGRRVLFLDDFISTGKTYNRVLAGVTEAGGTIVGAYLYRDGKYRNLTALPNRVYIRNLTAPPNSVYTSGVTQTQPREGGA